MAWVPAAITIASGVTIAALTRFATAWSTASDVQRNSGAEEYSANASATLTAAAERLRQLEEEARDLSARLAAAPPDSRKSVAIQKALTYILELVSKNPTVPGAKDLIEYITDVQDGQDVRSHPGDDDRIGTAFVGTARTNAFLPPAPPTLPTEKGKSISPSSDKFLELKPPFEFDGSKETYRAWRDEVLAYFAASAFRVRSPAEAAIHVRSFTLAGSDAKETLSALSSAVLRPGSLEHEEFHKLSSVSAVVSWILAKMDDTYLDQTLIRSEALRLRRRQNDLPVAEWLRSMEKSAHICGMDEAQLMVFVLTGISPALALQISLRAGVHTTELTLRQIKKYGSMCESELAAAAPRSAPRKDTAPSGSRSRASRPAKASQTNTITETTLGGGKITWKDHLSEEDTTLVLDKRVCSWCYSANHFSENCVKDRPVMMNDAIRARLRAQVHIPRANVPAPRRNPDRPGRNNNPAAARKEDEAPKPVPEEKKSSPVPGLSARSRFRRAIRFQAPARSSSAWTTDDDTDSDSAAPSPSQNRSGSDGHQSGRHTHAPASASASSA